MYIRYKLINDIRYHYVCECRRVNGKPKQIVIAYLGIHSSIDEAISHHRIKVSDLEKKLACLDDSKLKKRVSLEKQIAKSTEKIKELMLIQWRSA